jgi:hypothetical protein
VARGPLRAPRDLVGRADLLGGVGEFVRAGQSCVLLGERRMGKTSLLNALSHRDTLGRAFGEDPGAVVLTLDLLGAQDAAPDDLVDLLLESGDLPGGGVRALHGAARRAAREGRALLVVLDEFHVAGRNPRLDLSFFGVLRAAAGAGAAFLLASTRALADPEAFPVELVGSPFFNIFQVFRVGPWTAEGTGELLAHHLPDMPPSRRAWLAEAVHSETGGVPFFAQLLAWHAVEEGLTTAEHGLDERLDAAVRGFRQDAAPHLEVYWRACSEAERRALAWWARSPDLSVARASPATPCCCGDSSQHATNPGSSRSEYHPVARALEARGHVRVCPDGVAVRSRAFAAWVAECCPVAETTVPGASSPKPGLASAPPAGGPDPPASWTDAFDRPDVRSRLPAPIAFPLKRMVCETSATRRLLGLRDFVESVIRFFSGLGCALLRAADDEALSKKPLAPLFAPRPSLGDWLPAIRSGFSPSVLARADAGWLADPVGRLLVRRRGKPGPLLDALQTFVETRNALIGHGALLADSVYEDTVLRCGTDLMPLLGELDFRARLPLVVPVDVAYGEGSGLRHRARLLVGESVLFELVPLETELRLPLQVPLLVDAAATRSLRLDPFLTYRTCDVCGFEEVFFLNGASRGKRSYFTYRGGHEVSDP